MRNLFLATIVLVGAVFSVQSDAKEFYRWVDDEGVTHYTVTAPKDRASTLIRTQIGAGSKSSSNAIPTSRVLPGDEAGSTPKPQTAEAAKPEVQMTALDPQRCSVARANVETLNNHARIKVTGADGSIRYLSDDELNEKRAEAEAAIRESCE
ncbi:hypothetical protein R50072_09700 [Simiduia litorea]|uniref:DUF4124 domain-containing protein n=1 Tax=Simiduia litorea TaxID=1435348 RepID=UPI0036F29E58